MNRLGNLLILTGLIPTAVAMAAVVGLGVIRELPPWAISAGAVAVVLGPSLAMGGFSRLRRVAVGLGLWVWPCLVMAGLPLYFPGERGDALASGLAALVAPGGVEVSATGAALGGWLDTVLPQPGNTGRAPPPPAEVVTMVADPPEPASAAPAVPVLPKLVHQDDVALPYEGSGRTLRVPVGFESSRGSSQEVWMLFDTGATFTTLNLSTLRRLGLTPDSSSPTVTLHTANGERQASLVLLDRVWLGGLPVEGITVAVCDACGSDDSAGLLGLNVSHQFQVTVDPQRHEIVLVPRSDLADRVSDVQPWVDIDATATVWPDGRVEVEVELVNNAPRDILSASVGIHCDVGDFRTTIEDVDAGDSASRTVTLPRGTRCGTYRIFPGLSELVGSRGDAPLVHGTRLLDPRAIE